MRHCRLEGFLLNRNIVFSSPNGDCILFTYQVLLHDAVVLGSRAHLRLDNSRGKVGPFVLNHIQLTFLLVDKHSVMGVGIVLDAKYLVNVSTLCSLLGQILDFVLVFCQLGA
jgi:hypothetical protein